MPRFAVRRLRDFYCPFAAWQPYRRTQPPPLPDARPRPEWASPPREASPRSPMNKVTNAQILRGSSFALPLMTELQDREPGYQPIHADRLSEQHMIAALACMSSPASC